MKKLLLACILLFAVTTNASTPDTTVESNHSVLIVPYNPMMHLSDSDMDIAQGSEMEISKTREVLRKELIKSLNKKFSDVKDYEENQRSFVKEDNGDDKLLYHSLLYTSDVTSPVKNPAKFAVKDSLPKKDAKLPKKDSNYINVQINDQYLISDLSSKYEADYIIFLNELDIKTYSDDCINLALKIYRRDVKVHYSIFDKSGKQVYGDVAVAYFDSNSNDVKEISRTNFPVISDYILKSFQRATEPIKN